MGWGTMAVRTKIQNIVLSVTYDDTEFDLGKVARSLDGVVRGSSPLPGASYSLDECVQGKAKRVSSLSNNSLF